MKALLRDRKGFTYNYDIEYRIPEIYFAAPIKSNSHVMRCDAVMNHFYKESFEKLTFMYSHMEDKVLVYEEVF